MILSWYRGIVCVLLVTYITCVAQRFGFLGSTTIAIWSYLPLAIVDRKVQVSNEKDKTLVIFRVYKGIILPSYVGITIYDYKNTYCKPVTV